MSLALSFVYGSFICTALVSLYYFWTMNETDSSNPNTREKKLNNIKSFLEAWKKSLLIWVVILILYFLFYSSLMLTMLPTSQFIDETGASLGQIKTEDYRMGWELLKIMIALVYIDSAVLIWRIFNQTQILVAVLGTRFKQKKPSKYQDFV